MTQTFIRTFSDQETKATAVASHAGKVDVYWSTAHLDPSLVAEYESWRADILKHLHSPSPFRFCAVVDGKGTLVAEIGLAEKAPQPAS